MGSYTHKKILIKNIGVAELDKIDFRTQNITGAKERIFMIKGSTHQEDVTILNICAQ